MAVFKKHDVAADMHGITEGVIWKQMLLFFFPILLGTFFQQLYNTVDAMVVGKFVGKQALAAVGGATGTLVNLIVGFFVGLSSGATVIISQYFGAREENGVSRTVHTAIAMGLGGGLILSIAGIIVSPAILRLMDTPETVLPDSISYFRTYFTGSLAFVLYNICMGILQAVGDSRHPLQYLIISSLVNVVLDLLFVGVFHMGVWSAAAATAISQLVSMALCLLRLMRSERAYRVSLRKIRFDRRALLEILQNGLPAGLQSVMYSLSNIIIQASVNGFGTDVMAAYTAYGKVDGMYWMVINAFGVAITTFVGQNFGARLYDRMKKSINVCLGIAAAVTLLLSGVLMVVAEPLLGLFSDDAQVLEIGLSIVRLIVPTYITYIFIEILSGAMRGAGDSLIPTIMTLTGVCLLRVFWVTVVVSAHHELNVLLLSYPITWIVTSGMFVVYYLRGRWLKRCIALQNAEN